MRPLPSPPAPRAVAAALLLAAAAGCSFFSEPTTCQQSIQPGLVVTVRDSVTGKFVADSASGLVYSAANDWADTMSVGVPGQTLEGIWERPGTYRVIVSRPGYFDWIQSGIEVTKGSCNVNTLRVTALMQK